MTNKTVATQASVTDFIDSLSDQAQRDDTERLVRLFGRITGEPPVMWGTAIIGFGSARLKYASGRELDWLRVGFSPRKGKISLYLTFDAEKLTAQFPDLGSYSIGKGCIYLKRLADVNIDQLEALVRTAYTQTLE